MFVRVQGLVTEEAAGTLSAAVEKSGAARDTEPGQPQPIDLDEHERHRKQGDALVRSIAESAAIQSRFFPRAFGRPLYWRMQEGAEHGWHTDPAITGSENQIRTDVTAVIFLTAPETYEGGATLVRETGSATRFKLPAGDALLYPSHLMRGVEKVEKGTRIAATLAIQSLVREPMQRQVLVDIDNARQSMLKKDAGADEAILLLRAHGNLLRLWAEL